MMDLSYLNNYTVSAWAITDGLRSPLVRKKLCMLNISMNKISFLTDRFKKPGCDK